MEWKIKFHALKMRIFVSWNSVFFYDLIQNKSCHEMTESQFYSLIEKEGVEEQETSQSR